MLKCVKLVQTSKYGWQLMSPKGTVMVDDLSFADLYRAENWVKAYISSHHDWDYEIIPKETQ